MQPSWTPHKRTGKPTIKDYFTNSIANAQQIGPCFFSVPGCHFHHHYLQGSGTPLEINFGVTVEDEKGKMLYRNIMNGIEDAVRYADSKTNNVRIRSKERQISLAETKKWFWALDKIPWSGDGEVKQAGGCVELSLRYHLFDPYDFNYEDLQAGLLKDRDYRRLHDVGLAKEFLITGSTATIKLRWSRGKYSFPSPDQLDFMNGSNIHFGKLGSYLVI